MKKAFWLLLLGVVLLGAPMARADVRSDSLDLDPRFIDDVDGIWFYPNMVNLYKNLADTRTNKLNSTGVWGGLLDGQLPGLGVVGAYVYRPFGYDGSLAQNLGAPGWHGVGNGWWAAGWNIFAVAGGYPAPGYAKHWAVTTPENKADLFWGTTLNNGSFGVHVNYADAEGTAGISPVYNNGDQTNTNNANAGGDASQTTSNDSRVLGANLGLGLSDTGPFSNLNLHAGYFLGFLSDSEANVRNAAGAGTGYTYNNTLKDNGIGTLAFGALGDAKLDDTNGLKVFADAYLDNNAQTEHLTRDDNTTAGLHNDPNDIDETYGGKYNDIVSTLGFGCNHKVLDGKATISSGLQVYWINATKSFNAAVLQDATATSASVTNGSPTYDSATWDIWDVAWNASVEAKLTGWLTARAGLNRPIVLRTSTATTQNTFVSNAVQSTVKTVTNVDSYFGNNGSTYSLGLGIDFENFELDAAINAVDLFSTLGNVSPGNGIFFQNNYSNSNFITGTIFTNYNADLRYRF